MNVIVRVPATTANLGPGFDCMALALDLWNEFSISLEGQSVKVAVSGEGADHLPAASSNLVIRAMKQFYGAVNQSFPQGISVRCTNHIPTSSGLGSSSTAILAGMLSANALIQKPLPQEIILHMAAHMEGHPDNIAGALLGSLVVVAQDERQVKARRIPLSALPWKVVVVLPDFRLSTAQARAALPARVGLDQAVYNLGRVSFVLEAFRTGDLDLLRWAMQDRLHQPHRLQLIPGAMSALFAAQKLGAAAALSGAGPSLIAFCLDNETEIIEVMRLAFKNAGLKIRHFVLEINDSGAQVVVS